MGKKFEEIKNRCKNFSIYQERVDSPEQLELVFYHRDVQEWIKFLEGIFGVALKPEGVVPDPGHLKLTADYGGILKDQTLFKSEWDGLSVLAMFWPWQNGMYTTLKIFILPK